ncbi:phenazine biosynthesis protein [Tengunoibacter tsumagoiensis]|uniref:Phenazine antibiotic biosynthesis protein n=1 Tax=Tengunoibacter tsumagoiensis TaxID=2014871 RepID=A0A402A8Y5_9CHLR|nr:phenazine biosynthesis protein [Tengunoibacter tsumagoiensis]GCE15622.1 phenazine antibiotic biosynthesis protein [Tengunoibacter tsumagoiensis]
MSALFERPFDALPEPDELVRETMQWHFQPQTGSPFWLRQKDQLPFDPLTDIRTVADLYRFPDVSSQWKHIAVEDLIPRGCRQEQAWEFSVFESGSTTGSPKRIIESTSRRRGIDWINSMLTMHGIPEQGHWLHIGPTGPHIVGRSIGLVAHLRSSLCYYIDFDPRWVKKCIQQQRLDITKLYLDHIISQAVNALETQPISMLFATPPVLEAICKRPEVLALFQKRIRVLIWAGTSISTESLYLLEEEFFPDTKIIGWYGNTLMGIACQRPRVAEDTELCVFQPFYPYCLVDVVRPESPGELVDYGEVGQVRMTLLTKELFVPNVLERDSALRQKPVAGFAWDGLARIGTLDSARNQVIEGVY